MATELEKRHALLLQEKKLASLGVLTSGVAHQLNNPLNNISMFDTVGTLIGCATKTNMIQDDGSIVNCKEALFADAIGTTVGALLGTSTVTTFVESSSGIAEGGRTGMTSLVVAILFLLSLFLEPLFGSIPSAATAPALIIVGVLMMSPVKQMDWDDMTEAVPGFLTMFFPP